jgi:hypothetical protein
VERHGGWRQCRTVRVGGSQGKRCGGANGSITNGDDAIYNIEWNGSKWTTVALRASLQLLTPVRLPCAIRAPEHSSSTTLEPMKDR